MGKRVLFAILLSWLVLLGWSLVAPKSQIVDNNNVTGKNTTIAKEQEPAKTQVALDILNSASVFKYEQGRYDLSFIESQAAIKDVLFKDYQGSEYNLRYGLLLGDGKLVFKKEKQAEGELVFVHSDKDKKIFKEFIFDNTNYSIDLRIEILNQTTQDLSLSLPIVLGAFDPKLAQANYYGIAINKDNKIVQPALNKDATLDGAKFLSLRNRYFCIIAQPDNPGFKAFVKKADDKLTESGYTLEFNKIPPQARAVEKIRIYLGPQDVKMIGKVNPEWAGIINYGSFDFISQLILGFLEFLYKLVHNLGVAIILLSIIIYFVLYPLSLKQMRSVKEMQALQPKIEELRKLYKDNPQKMNKEILELYRLHKVNPLGGCLPLVLQIPIFLALYQVLTRSITLKGAPFLWVKDLSEPDKLIVLDKTLPFIGNQINILPIAVAVIMFFQQKSSLANAGTANAEQQKMMMILFPIIFGALFYHVPSGLVLYWFVNSLLMFVFQWKVTHSHG